MSGQKFLLVKGCAGIGNRLFTLAAAIKYATRTKRKLVIDWRDGVFAEPGKDAFSHYFTIGSAEVVPVEKIENLQNAYSFYPTSLKGNAEKKLYDLFMPASSGFFSRLPGAGRLRGRMSRLNDFWYFSPGDNFNKSINSGLKAARAVFSSCHVEHGNKLKENLSEDVVLFADYWPGNVEEVFIRQIQFKEEIIAEVEKLKVELKLGENSCGVHVRFSDKKPGKELDNLIRTLAEEIKSGKNIFLSTDNESIEDRFRSAFGSQLVTLSKFFPKRKQNENMHHWSLKSSDYSKVELIYRESLLDMQLLASCGTLYYQGNSSFSKLALVFKKTSGPSYDWLKANGI